MNQPTPQPIIQPTAKPQTIELGGKKYTLHFDLNTFAAFEEVTGRFVMEIFGNDAKQTPLKLMRALLWASCHTYDKNGEPYWPMTIGQLGRLIDINNAAAVMATLNAGVVANSAPETKASENGAGPLVDPPTQADSSPTNPGGTTSLPSDEDVLALLDKN